MSKVAVILPTFKPGSYLKDNFDAIKKQTLKHSDYCVYIGLNGPRCGYEEFVLELLKDVDFSYKYFYFATTGVSFARNALIEESVEDYLVFVDDDDLISTNYFESLLAVTSYNTMGISNIINFKGDIDNQFNNYIGNSFDKLNRQGGDHFKYRKYFSSPCAKMLHRRMINNIQFDVNLAIGEDGFFMANISKNIKFFKKSISSAIYYVNVRESSSSRKCVEKRLEFARVIYLTKCYIKMLFIKQYNKKFIISRIVASLLHLRRLV